jgi:hypothetical protein
VSGCLLRQPHGDEGIGLGGTVAPPDELSVTPPHRDPNEIHQEGGAVSAAAPAAHLGKSHVSEVTQFLNLEVVVAEGPEEALPPATQSLVPPSMATSWDSTSI